jgi:hypothetical protein
LYLSGELSERIIFSYKTTNGLKIIKKSVSKPSTDQSSEYVIIKGPYEISAK